MTSKVTRPISTRDARALLRILVGADDVLANAIFADMQEGCTFAFAGLELASDDDAQTFLLTAPQMVPGLMAVAEDRPAPDIYASMSSLDAAAWLEAVKQACELADATSPYEIDWRAELDELRAEARRAFERKFFEVS